MDFDWFFKRGHNGVKHPDLFLNDPDNMEDFGNNQEDKIKSSDFPFMDPFGNIEDSDIFQRMDDMIGQIFKSQFTPFGSIRFEANIPNQTDPRSQMLKDPECAGCEQYPVESFGTVESSHLVDSDIDDEVAKHGLLLDEHVPKYNTPQNFSYKKFSSIRTVCLPDGTLEEHKSVADSQGNVTTTVRQSIGDQSYEVTTHTDEYGIKEKQENLLNLDENELSDFRSRWQDLKTGKVYPSLHDFHSESSLPKLTPPKGDPSYLVLFKKFFGL